MKHSLRTCLPYYLTAAALCLLAYWPTFTGEFILDDRPLIENNISIRTTQNPLLFFFHEDGITDKSLAGQYHTGYYRPLTNITYWIDYRLWGMNPAGFRATNLLLHITASLLLFHFLLHFVQTPAACLAAAVVFALHPAHTESVSFVASRNNILVAIFSIACMLCWFRDNSKTSRVYYGASVLFFAIALGFKEFAVMVLPLLFLYRRLFRGSFSITLKEVAGYIPFVLVIALYIFARYFITETVLSASEDGDLLNRMIYAPWLVLLNLKYLLLPYGLHSFIIDYPPGLITIESMTGISGCLFLMGAVWFYRRNTAFLFAVAGFLFGLFPVLNIIKTSAVTLVSLRWLYFPALFLSLPLAGLIARGWTGRRRPMTIAFLAAAVVYMGGYSYTLNRYLWHDEGTFFHQEVTHFKNDFYLSGLAVNLFERGFYLQAQEYYIRSLEAFPLDIESRISYAGLLVALDQLDQAEKQLRKVESFLKAPVDKAEWFNNFGMIYFKKNEYSESLGYFTRAAAYAAGNPLFWANKGSALGAMGRYDEAVEVFEKGLQLHPGDDRLAGALELARQRSKQAQ